MIPSKKYREKPTQIRRINRRTKTPKRHKKTHGNHNAEASIQTMKDSNRSSFPPQHPSIPLSRSHHEVLKLVIWKNYGK
jgi:hypothetical protein